MKTKTTATDRVKNYRDRQSAKKKVERQLKAIESGLQSMLNSVKEALEELPKVHKKTEK